MTCGASCGRARREEEEEEEEEREHGGEEEEEEEEEDAETRAAIRRVEQSEDRERRSLARSLGIPVSALPTSSSAAPTSSPHDTSAYDDARDANRRRSSRTRHQVDRFNPIRVSMRRPVSQRVDSESDGHVHRTRTSSSNSRGRARGHAIFRHVDSDSDSSETEWARKVSGSACMMWRVAIMRCYQRSFAHAAMLFSHVICFPQEDTRLTTERSKIQPLHTRNTLADIDPVSLDTHVDWSHVGGLDGHVRALKEMVVLPLLYPEVFDKFRVTPPVSAAAGHSSRGMACDEERRSITHACRLCVTCHSLARHVFVMV